MQEIKIVLLLFFLNSMLLISSAALSKETSMLNETVIANFKKIDAKFKNIWQKHVDEEKKELGEGFAINDVYPAKAAEVLFNKADIHCAASLANIEETYDVILPQDYKQFLCDNGTMQIVGPHGNQYFELWSPEKIISKSQRALSVFIERFAETFYDGNEDTQGQIPLLKTGVVFASSNLRGPDEYDVYFFAPNQSSTTVKIYAVEVKDGVWTNEYNNIQGFFSGIISAIDVNDISD